MAFLSFVSHTSKLIELKEEVVKTWGLNPFCQKHK